jgi:hypothetical protein
VYGGRIHVLGGESTAATFDANEAYDPKSRRWLSMEPLLTARHGLGAAVVGGRLFVIGGGPEPGLSVTGANEVLLLLEPRVQVQILGGLTKTKTDTPKKWGDPEWAAPLICHGCDI